MIARELPLGWWRGGENGKFVITVSEFFWKNTLFEIASCCCYALMKLPE